MCLIFGLCFDELHPTTAMQRWSLDSTSLTSLDLSFPVRSFIRNQINFEHDSRLFEKNLIVILAKPDPLLAFLHIPADSKCVCCSWGLKALCAFFIFIFASCYVLIINNLVCNRGSESWTGDCSIDESYCFRNCCHKKMNHPGESASVTLWCNCPKYKIWFRSSQHKMTMSWTINLIWTAFMTPWWHKLALFCEFWLVS